MVERPMTPKPYYLLNFERLCAHALQNHAGQRAGLLTTEEGRALAAFMALPLPAQMLFVRLLTRKGPWLRSDRLDYPEVGDAVAAADALVEAGLVTRNEPVPAAALLALLRDEETRPLAAALGLPARAGVGARHAALAARIPARWLAAWVAQRFDWLRVHPRGWIDTLLLLFFGNRRQDLSTFVVADLGHVRYEPVAEAALRVFDDAADFRGFRALLDARDAASSASAHADVPAMLAAAVRLAQAPDHRLLPGRRARALVRLAEAFGRAGHAALGITLCVLAGGPEAAHRRALLEARPSRAGTPAGTPAATSPRARRAPPFRPEQRQLALEWRTGQVEQCTLAWLREQGYRGAHYENHFATALFGLACWDIVFTAVPGAFFNPWQVGPADLYDDAFMARRGEAFAARFEDIRAGNWRTRIARCARDKQGIANPFVDWRALDWPLFEDLCDGLADATVAAMCTRIAQDPRRACSGFPDLSLRRGDAGTEFCEVKSPNDQLSARQRDWLQLLQACGHPAWVARIATAGLP